MKRYFYCFVLVDGSEICDATQGKNIEDALDSASDSIVENLDLSVITAVFIAEQKSDGEVVKYTRATTNNWTRI
jgi:hypothetical protein